ncbi:protein-glutamate O-methyltransferase CheR [Novosphingobium sp.]|uniref:CheR family methyltransferase n=1 Tax=Novosphingobium sp. TaxID=1874826 RepID=UPI0035AF4CBF
MVDAAFLEDLPGISPAVYGTADFDAIARLVYDEAGIVLARGKAMLVYSRIAPLVRNSGCATFSAYLEQVRADPAERMRTVTALTTNHTFFYREEHHFAHFAAEVRPDMVRRLEAGQPVRMWSAGCSSGEETWSLVMTLLGSDLAEGRRIAGRDVLVLASDIAPHALTKAEAARYEAKDLAPVPAALVQNWTRSDGSHAEIGGEARRIVRFRSLNLQGEWPMRGRFDVIFCRNVMIYFDLPTKERLIQRFTQLIAPGGHLYIGHSERATGPAAAELELIGPTIYRRRNS